MSKHRRAKSISEHTLFDILGVFIDWVMDQRWFGWVMGDEPYDRKWHWRGLTFDLNNRGENAPMGRFGGGWQRSLGIQAGRTTVIINLWKSSLRIQRVKK